MKFYMFPISSFKITLVLFKALVIPLHNMLLLVFVDLNLILRNVLGTRCDRLRITGA